MSVLLAPRAPGFVTAAQGPADPDNLYVDVYWTRDDVSATGYQVYEGTTLVGTVATFNPPKYGAAGSARPGTDAYDDTWDKCRFRRALPNSTAAGTVLAYTVVATGPRADGSPSRAAQVKIVVSPSSGARCFTASAQAGANALARARAAIAAAEAAAKDPLSPAVALLDQPLTLATDITDMITVSTDYVIVRGVRGTYTDIASTFAGSTAACPVAGSDLKRLMYLDGTLTTMAGVGFAAPTTVGQRVTALTSTAGLAVGDVVHLDDGGSFTNVVTLDANPNILMDPADGRDNRRPFDMAQVEAINGLIVTWAHPLSQQHTTATPFKRLTKGRGNRLEYLRLSGTDPNAVTYHTLIQAHRQHGLVVTECAGRYHGRTLLEVLDSSDAAVLSCDFTARQHDVTTTTSCKYVLSVRNTDGTRMLGNAFGAETLRLVSSPMTTQIAQRTVAAGNTVFGARNYGFNEHGGGSRHAVVTGNRFRDCGWTADTAGVPYGALFLGHPEYGFCGRVLVNNNLFQDSVYDIVLYQNSYEIMITANVSRGLRAATGVAIGGRHIYAAGWGNDFGTPSDVDPLDYGSQRSVAMYEHVSAVNTTPGAASLLPDGIEVGANAFDTVGTTQFPYLGGKRWKIARNYLAIPAGRSRVVVVGTKLGNPLDAQGNARSAHYQVYENAGTGNIVMQSTAGPGVYVAANEGSATAVGAWYPVPYSYQDWPWVRRATIGSPIPAAVPLAFVDDFDRADGAVGADWTVTLGSAAVAATALAATGAGTNRVVRTAPTVSGDQWVEAVMRSTTADGLFVRGTLETLSAGDDGFYSRASGTSLVVTSVTNGAGAQLGATMAVPARTTADGIRLTARFDPDNPLLTIVEVWWKAGGLGDWVLMGTRLSYDHPAGRHVGARNGGNAGRWDSIAGGDLVDQLAADTFWCDPVNGWVPMPVVAL